MNGYWAAITQTRVRVLCNGPETGTTPLIDGGALSPVKLPAHGMYLDAYDMARGVRAVVKGHNGTAYLIDWPAGFVQPLGRTIGVNCVALNAHGEPVFVGPPVDGGVLPPNGGGQGFLGFETDGVTPRWLDDHRFITLGGVVFGQPVRWQHWEVGQDQHALRYLAYDHRDGSLWVVGPSENSPQPLRIAVHDDGSCTVARSYPSGWFHSSTFQPYTVVQAPPTGPEPTGGNDDSPELPIPHPTPPAPTPIPPVSEVPSMPAPSFDQWIVKELREKIIPAHEAKHGPKSEEWKTGVEWGAHQTYRRNGTLLGLGENWTLEQIIAHERGEAPPFP